MAKLEEMVENHLKLCTSQASKEEEKSKPEPVVEETKAEASNEKKKRARKTMPLRLPVN